MRKRLLAMTCLSVRPSVRLVQLGCRLIFMKLHIWGFFEYLSRTFTFRPNLTRITATVHDDLCSYILNFPLILVRMRNASDKSCRENQSTHFLFNIFPPKMYVYIYIYIYKICLLFKLVNNAELSSVLKGMLCAVRMEQRRTRMLDRPFCSTALNKLYALLLQSWS